MSLIAGGAVDPTVALFGVPFTRLYFVPVYSALRGQAPILPLRITALCLVCDQGRRAGHCGLHRGRYAQTASSNPFWISTSTSVSRNWTVRHRSPRRRRSRHARMRSAAAERASGGGVGPPASCESYIRRACSLLRAANLPDSRWAYIQVFARFNRGRQRMI